MMRLADLAQLAIAGKNHSVAGRACRIGALAESIILSGTTAPGHGALQISCGQDGGFGCSAGVRVRIGATPHVGTQERLRAPSSSCAHLKAAKALTPEHFL